MCRPRAVPARGLAKLLRRNPTDAERIFWDALTRDRRFAGFGFKRQTPVGPIIADIVSFPLRVVIEIVPAQEDDAAAKARVHRQQWLREHNYEVLEAREAAIAADLSACFDRRSRSVRAAPRSDALHRNHQLRMRALSIGN